MSLRTVIAGATQAAFAAAGDIPVSCSITRTTGQTYDPVTDTYTGGTPTDYEFHGIMSTDSRQYREGSTVQTGDMLLVARQDDVGITPDIGEVVTVNDVDWQIINFSQDGAGAVFRMQLRK